MKPTHYTPGGRTDHGPFCCCRVCRPHLHRQERTMEKLSDVEIRNIAADDGEKYWASERRMATEIRDLRAQRAASRERVRDVVMAVASGILEHPESKVLRTFDVADAIAARAADALAAPHPALDAERVREVVRDVAFDILCTAGIDKECAPIAGDIAARAAEQLAGQAAPEPRRGTPSPERAEVDRVARLLIAEWERVEGKPVNVSYVATFADMARAVVADRPPLTPRAMTREQAATIAWRAAVNAMGKPGAPGYLQDAHRADWKPHEWVINAIVGAAQQQAQLDQAPLSADERNARVMELEAALRHIELLAFTGTQTAVTRGDDDGQRRAAFFRDIRETARSAMAISNAPIDLRTVRELALTLRAEELRGLQLMRLHLEDGGHDWSRGTAMTDVAAATALLDRLLKPTDAVTYIPGYERFLEATDGPMSRCRCHQEAGDTLCSVHPPSIEELAYAESIGAPYHLSNAPTAPGTGHQLSAVDPALCRRLANEAAKDDARMPRAPWGTDQDCHGQLRDGSGLTVAATNGRFHALDDNAMSAIARTRNNLPEVARQLTAAAVLAERHAELERFCDADKSLELAEHHEESINRIADALGDESEWSNCCDRGEVALDLVGQLRAERDAARAECERLRQECDDAADRDAEIYRLRRAVVRLRALLATEPAVTEERCGEIERHNVTAGAVKELLAAARQLHALRAGLREIVGDEPAPRAWAVTPERVEALKHAVDLLSASVRNSMIAESRSLAAMLAEVSP